MRAPHVVAGAIALTLLIPARGHTQTVSATSPPPAAPAHQTSYRDTVADPLTRYSRAIHTGLKAVMLASAMRMPEDRYGYRPTDSVRTYAQILAHVADAQYMFCAAALGERNPSPRVEQTKRTKADIITALKDAGAYCDRVFVGMTDVSGAELTTYGGAPAPRLGIMTASYTHAGLHCGNLVTYLRMNGIVPPSSDPALMPQARRE